MSRGVSCYLLPAPHRVCVFHVSAVLCADRVGQMTKTYHDIDAVTRLLEEVRCCTVIWSISEFQSCTVADFESVKLWDYIREDTAAPLHFIHLFIEKGPCSAQKMNITIWCTITDVLDTKIHSKKQQTKLHKQKQTTHIIQNYTQPLCWFWRCWQICRLTHHQAGGSTDLWLLQKKLVVQMQNGSLVDWGCRIEIT